VSNRLDHAGLRRPPSVHDDAAEQFGHWIRSCCGDERSQSWLAKRSITLTKAANETVSGAGGFLLPEQVDAEILALRDSYSAFRQCDVRPATTANTVRPRRVGGATAYWTAEGATITESNLSWDAIEAPAAKLAVLCRFSAELLADSAPDLGSYLAQELAFAMAVREDEAGFTGIASGTATVGRFEGLKAHLTGTSGAVSTAGHSTFASVDSADIAKAVAAVSGPAAIDGAFYCSPAAFASVFCRLASTTGGIVRTPSGLSYMGWPVFLSAALPTAASAGEVMFWFGSLRRSSTLFEGSPLVVAFSRDRSMETDQILVRGTSRISIINHDAPGELAMFIGAS
jgi:HK97 family phage major capsid protein